MSINGQVGTVAQTNVEQKLKGLQARAERAKDDHARAEAQLEAIAKQRETALTELAELGVSEDGLDQHIADLDKQIEAFMDEAEQLLPATESAA